MALNFTKLVYTEDFNSAFPINSVTANIINGKFSNNLVYGTTVEVDALSDVTVNDYAGSITSEALTNSKISVDIDQDKYTSVKIDTKQSFIRGTKLYDEVLYKTTQAFSKVFDAYILGKVRDGGTGLINLEGVTITAANVLDKIFVPLVQKFNEAEVPEMGRKLIVTPAIDAIIRQADILQRVEGLAGNGYAGTVMGIDVYWSNYLPANAITGSLKDMVALHSDAFCYAGGLNEMDLIPSSVNASSFDDILKERMVYGGKVINPAAIINLKFDV